MKEDVELLMDLRGLRQAAKIQASFVSAKSGIAGLPAIWRWNMAAYRIWRVR